MEKLFDYIKLLVMALGIEFTDYLVNICIS